jgi:hypothetical protein
MLSVLSRLNSGCTDVLPEDTVCAGCAEQTPAPVDLNNVQLTTGVAGARTFNNIFYDQYRCHNRSQGICVKGNKIFDEL